MQLQTETRPALTGPAVVEHADVQLPASDLPVSLLISTESSEQSRQRSLIIGEAAFAQHSSARLAPRAVRGLDDATLNKPQGRTVNLAMPIEEIFAAPIEVWEGEVKMVDGKAQTMHVYLRSKVALASDHAAEIDLEWVPEQDKDLVRPGAVFYWTIYKETKAGSVKNSEEIRFRRRSAWSKAQLERILTEAARLFPQPKSPKIFDPNG